MAVEIKTQLRLLREMFQDTGKQVSQEAIARRAGITLQAYRNVENGGNTRWTTANALLRAVNAERAGRGMEPIVLDQLGLTIV